MGVTLGKTAGHGPGPFSSSRVKWNHLSQTETSLGAGNPSPLERMGLHCVRGAWDFDGSQLALGKESAGWLISWKENRVGKETAF